MKKKLFIIHGGMTFKNKNDYIFYLKNRDIILHKKEKWHAHFINTALSKEFDIIRILMPSQDNAHYKYWNIHFTRYLSFFDKHTALIGVSLGGIFLAKFLSEHKLTHNITSLCLVAPPFDNSLYGEDLVNGFSLKKNLKKINENCKNIHLFFSQDDDIVPVSHAKKYKKVLPNADYRIYKSKNGHFRIKTFPEIVTAIKKDFL